MHLAEKTTDLAQKPFLLMMARAWHNLAGQAERNSKADLAYADAAAYAAHQRQRAPPKRRRAKKSSTGPRPSAMTWCPR